ncbi:MAG: hypothetical protein ABUL64_01590 [Singulisphaera sp.]
MAEAPLSRIGIALARVPLWVWAIPCLLVGILGPTLTYFADLGHWQHEVYRLVCLVVMLAGFSLLDRHLRKGAPVPPPRERLRFSLAQVLIYITCLAVFLGICAWAFREHDRVRLEAYEQAERIVSPELESRP